MLAIVLERRDFREFDQIITFLTQERGKVEALARGIKKITAKNSASLEPGSLVEAEIVPGKDIAHFTKAQAQTIFPAVRTDFKKISYLAIVVHLVNRLVSGEEQDARAFELLRSFLFFLENSEQVASRSVAAFGIKLLSVLGFSPVLDQCIVCATPLLPQVSYVFDLGGGGIVCGNCLGQKRFEEQQLIPNISAPVLAVLRRLLSASWDEIHTVEVEERVGAAAEDVVYRFAVYHSGQKLPDWRRVGALV